MNFTLSITIQDDDWEDVDDERENGLAKDVTIQSIIEAMFASSSDYPGIISNISQVFYSFLMPFIISFCAH